MAVRYVGSTTISPIHHKHIHIHTYRQPGRQAGRQAGRQTDRQTDRHTYIRTDIHTDTLTYMLTYLNTYLDTHTCIMLYTQTLTLTCTRGYVHIPMYNTWHRHIQTLPPAG